MGNGEKWGKTAGFTAISPSYPIVVGTQGGFSRGKVGNWQVNEDFLCAGAWEWRKKKNMGIIPLLSAIPSIPARVVKLVDAGDSKSPAARRAGSIPAPGTI